MPTIIMSVFGLAVLFGRVLKFLLFLRSVFSVYFVNPYYR